MSNAIESLLDLYKVDNSRETTDKMAKALKVAGIAILNAKQGFNGLLCFDEYVEKHYTDLLNVEQKIQAITEGKGDE